MRPFVSVIVPVYNAATVLERCINSILSSDYKNFELILVDDGSSDNSGAVCDQYAEQFENIKVIHQKNQGVSVARNAGLDIAHGEWIAFVDSDDEVTSRYLSDMVSAILPNFTGLIIQGVEKIQRGVSFVHAVQTGFYKDSQIHCLLEEHGLLFLGYPVAKLYNAFILQKYHIRFDTEIHMSEDLVFMLQYILHINQISVLPGSNYHYFYYTSSACSKYFSFESELYGYEKLEELVISLCRKYHTENSAKLQGSLGIALFRPVLSLYMGGDYSFRERQIKLKMFLDKWADSVEAYYSPRLFQMKMAKYLLHSPFWLFDCYMRIILRKHIRNSEFFI